MFEHILKRLREQRSGANEQGAHASEPQPGRRNPLAGLGIGQQLAKLRPQQLPDGGGGGGGGGGKPIVFTPSARAPIERGGVTLPADDFGITEISDTLLPSTITIVETPTAWEVSASFLFRQNWDVYADLGPRGEVNIESADDPDLHQGNCQQAADDLTPDANGFTPREQFWARDLSEDHERAHHLDNADLREVVQANWEEGVEARQAASEFDVRQILRQEYKLARQAIDVHTGHGGASEATAKRAGIPDYQRRSDEIRARCAAGRYPAPPKRVHVVVAGEWLAKIAQDEGVELAELFRLNPHLGAASGRSFDRIFPGDMVNLPT